MGLGADLEVSRLRLRESAGRYFADVVVSVPPGQAVVEGHRAADLVESAIERVLPGSDVVVHVEPRRLGLDLRDRVLSAALSEPLVKEAHDIIIFEQQGSASVSLHLKFPAEMDLGAAHDVAERVERTIGEMPGVNDVQTHLEPLEKPLRARPVDGRAGEPAVPRDRGGGQGDHRRAPAAPEAARHRRGARPVPDAGARARGVADPRASPGRRTRGSAAAPDPRHSRGDRAHRAMRPADGRPAHRPAGLTAGR